MAKKPTVTASSLPTEPHASAYMRRRAAPAPSSTSKRDILGDRPLRITIDVPRAWRPLLKSALAQDDLSAQEAGFQFFKQYLEKKGLLSS